MNKSVVKKSLKVAGAFAAATGVVALSALVASGATVGAIAEGFKEAGKVVKKSLDKTEQEKKNEETMAEEDNVETVEVPMPEEMVKTEETVETQTVQAEGNTETQNA